MSSYLTADGSEWLCENCAGPDDGRWPCPDETDSPVHCANCGFYLAHPLTSHGVEYALEQAESECRKPIADRERIMPKQGTAEETLWWYHGSPHKAIVLDWLDDIAGYRLTPELHSRIGAMRRLLERPFAKTDPPNGGFVTLATFSENATQGDKEIIARAPELLADNQRLREQVAQLTEAVRAMIRDRIGDRDKWGKGDAWQDWANEYRDNPNVDKPLLLACDALSAVERGQK